MIMRFRLANNQQQFSLETRSIGFDQFMESSTKVSSRTCTFRALSPIDRPTSSLIAVVGKRDWCLSENQICDARNNSLEPIKHVKQQIGEVL